MAEFVISSPMQTCCPIVELRQYTLLPGKRDELIALFDQEFVESQEELGATIIGQFRDADDPNRFVWLRGFSDMESRGNALRQFYGGPVWKRHREAANATMVDSDNVLLLRPARPDTGFRLAGFTRMPVGTSGEAAKTLFASIFYFDAPVTADFLDDFERSASPAPGESGAGVLAYFVTENAPNNFPALPVREGENVFVCFSTRDDARDGSGQGILHDGNPRAQADGAIAAARVENGGGFAGPRKPRRFDPPTRVTITSR